MPNLFCRHESDWRTIFLDVKAFLPLLIDCFVDTMRLVESSTTTSRFVEPDGIDVSTVRFGDTDSIEYVDGERKLANLAILVVHLVERHGYRRGMDLFGAPYDFRYAPADNRVWMRATRRLVQEAVRRNGGRRVVIIAHSLGTLYSWYFLRQQSAEWRRQYVERLVAAAPPYGGASLALHAILSGKRFVFVCPYPRWQCHILYVHMWHVHWKKQK